MRLSGLNILASIIHHRPFHLIQCLDSSHLGFRPGPARVKGPPPGDGGSRSTAGNAEYVVSYELILSQSMRKPRNWDSLVTGIARVIPINNFIGEL
jgi:hypothetical protein